MKNLLQKIYDFKALSVFVVFALLFLGSNSMNAQFSATWQYTSGLTSTVTGDGSDNLTASAATYTSGTGGLFYVTPSNVTSSSGFLVGTGISGKLSTSCSSLYNSVGSTTPITPYLEYKIAPNAGYSMTTNIFTFTVENATTVSNVIVAAGYSVDGGTTFTGLAAPATSGAFTAPIANASPTGSNFGTVTGATAGTFTFTVPATSIAATNSFILRVVVWRNNASNSSSANLKIAPPVITGTTPVSLSPVITTPSPTVLTNFNYVAGNGPSASQSFSVGGSNLTENPVVTPTANYEISSDNITFASSAITLVRASGTVPATTLYARLKAGLTGGLYATTSPGTPEIVISSAGAVSQNVACSGYVSTNYYHDGTVGTLPTISNWWTSPGGVGTNPSSPTFASDPYNTFYIYADASTTAAWALGTLSKIIVGDGISAANLTIDPSFSISGGSINVSAGATLTVAHSTSPTLGTLNATSTVEYTAVTAAVPSSKTFGNLKITGLNSVATQASGVTTVAGNFTLANGAIYKIGNGSSGSILSIAGDFNVSGVGGLSTTSIISSATSATLTLTGTGKNIDNTASANDFVKLNIALNGTYSLANDFKYNTTSSSARTFTIGASGSLDLNGKKLALDNANSVAITAGGTLTADGIGSTVEFYSTSNQTVPSGSFYNLTTSGALTKTLSGASTVNGSLSVISSSLTTGTNNFTLGSNASAVFGPQAVLNITGGTTDFNNRPVTLQSTVAGSARIGTISGTLSGATNVTVERYIPAKRAWRALTAPVSTTTSILANWQEDGTGNSTNGFDIWSLAGGNGLSTGGGFSLLEYNSSANSWTGITATNGIGSMLNGDKNKPFMAFVTGPYATGNITNGLATATTLRAKGTLLTGTKTYATTGTQYTFIGNPYASSLNLTAMLADTDNLTDFSNGIWIWDASGNASVGSYNFFDKTANAYTDVITNPIIATAEIQSGQAFFVQSAADATFSIREEHKGTTANNVVLRTAAPELLRVGLYKQINTEWSGRDGAMTVILPDANANQTPNKMANGTENVAFTKSSGLFASNHHLPFVASDVLNVRVWNTTVGANYKLKINTEQFATTSLNATLEDLFTNSRTPLTLDGTAVEYPFAVTTEAASTGNRFRIVFETNALGINNPKATGISILPNPITGDTFQVNFGTLVMGTYTYSICNALGQEVEKGSINNVAKNTSSVVKFKNNTAAGMYVMKVTGADNSVFNAKIIKQ
jgi:hypothetical protein